MSTPRAWQRRVPIAHEDNVHLVHLHAGIMRHPETSGAPGGRVQHLGAPRSSASRGPQCGLGTGQPAPAQCRGSARLDPHALTAAHPQVRKAEGLEPQGCTVGSPACGGQCAAGETRASTRRAGAAGAAGDLEAVGTRELAEVKSCAGVCACVCECKCHAQTESQACGTALWASE